MGKIVIALFILAFLIFLATYAAIRYEVKNWCDANELNFKMYWKDFLHRKIRAFEDNEYFLEKYKIKKKK